MSYATFVPQEYSARILESLKDVHVYASLFKRDYEGDLRAAGDTVRIRSIGRPTVAEYVPYSTTISPEQIMGADQVLKVDQSFYTAVSVDDIDKRQADVDILNAIAKETSWAISDTVDADLATVLSDGVATANQVTAVTVGTGATDDDAYETLVDLRTQLNKANVGMEGRWVVVPPDYEGLLLKDPRFVSFGTAENANMRNNGKIGRAAGFNIHISNNVPLSSTTYTVIAGTNDAAAYVEQINKVEPYRPQDAFEDAVKTLILWGRKVIRPDGLVSVAVDFA